jgi:hypothetical protein
MIDVAFKALISAGAEMIVLFFGSFYFLIITLAKGDLC